MSFYSLIVLKVFKKLAALSLLFQVILYLIFIILEFHCSDFTVLISLKFNQLWQKRIFLTSNIWFEVLTI